MFGGGKGGGGGMSPQEMGLRKNGFTPEEFQQAGGQMPSQKAFNMSRTKEFSGMDPWQGVDFNQLRMNLQQQTQQAPAALSQAQTMARQLNSDAEKRRQQLLASMQRGG